MADTRLNATDFRVLMAVDSFDQMGAGGRGCVASRVTIAERINANRHSVATSIRKLERHGYLASVPAKNRAREYRIVFDQVGTDPHQPAAKLVPIDNSSWCGSVPHKESRKDSPPKEKNKGAAAKLGRAGALPAAAAQDDDDVSELVAVLRDARARGVPESEITRAFAIGQWHESIGGDREATTREEIEFAKTDHEEG
jgi:hypothetical protein